MDASEQIINFLDTESQSDGYDVLSGAKMRALGVDNQMVAISDEVELVAVGVVASHPQADGTVHWSVETVVARAMRFPAFEDATLERALALVPSGSQTSVWSRRTSLDEALARSGFTPVRSLAFMVVDLPLTTKSVILVDRFREGSEERLLSINRETFGDHREAGGLDDSELASLMSESWFDGDGILFHQIDGIDAGFCWTKVHENGDGEIYRIGVDERFQGRGLGKAMVAAGYRHLVEKHGVNRGTLWVDESNSAAVKMYEGIGLRIESRNREFSRTGD
jgi:mycothiol synthase